jgi:acylphosphatase
MNRFRMTIFYSGRVQGVGFRYTTRDVALGFEVTGTVRNLPDGRVELVAEGTREELETGVGGCIRNEEIRWTAATGMLRGFEIAR